MFCSNKEKYNGKKNLPSRLFIGFHRIPIVQTKFVKNYTNDDMSIHFQSYFQSVYYDCPHHSIITWTRQGR